MYSEMKKLIKDNLINFINDKDIQVKFIETKVNGLVREGFTLRKLNKTSSIVYFDELFLSWVYKSDENFLMELAEKLTEEIESLYNISKVIQDTIKQNKIFFQLLNSEKK